jgi:TolA-binding protein
MKKSGFLLLMIFLLLSPACKSPPPAAEEPGPESAGIAEMPAEEEALEPAELPSPDTPAEETGEAPAIDALEASDLSGAPAEEAGDDEDFPADDVAEPETEPELAGTGAFPPEDETLPVLPEPDAASLFLPPELVPGPVAESAPEKPAPVDEIPPLPPVISLPSPPSPPPPSPPPSPPPPDLGAAEEAPPPRLRPEEEDSSAGIVREPEPRPAAPVPARPEPEISPLAPPPAAADTGMVFSRVVRATMGQLVEIPFRGTGWVYLGELAARRGVNYDSRRLDPEGQSFIFRAEAAGIYALKFYKQDFIRDYILNDYVQVIVGEAPESSATGWFNPPLDRGRVSAERWPSSLEEADAIARGRAAAAGSVPTAERAVPETGSVPTADAVPSTGGSVPTADAVPSTGGSVPAVGSVPPTEQPSENRSAGSAESPLPVRPGVSDEGIVPVRPPVAAGRPERAVPGAVPPGPSAEAGSRGSPPEESFAEDYLQKAREEFDAGRVAGAIAALDLFREHFPSGSDEAWWLYGQFYEANSPSRDIRAALDYYRRLVREYPQSRRYNDARRRIAYLERYYINIQ